MVVIGSDVVVFCVVTVVAFALALTKLGFLCRTRATGVLAVW